MPTKLKLSFRKTAPKGDYTTICLVGKNGEIIPHLEKDVAAHLIGVMATAQFKGKFGKSLLIYTDKSSYLMIGTGDELLPGVVAEKLGGKMIAALGKGASKCGWLPNHGLDAEVVDGLTMFIGARDNNNLMRDIFIHDARVADRLITMTAESGEFIERNGSPTLVLQNGERSERNADGQSGAVLLFDSHSVTITRTRNQPMERSVTDINEDTISNLLSSNAASSPQYYLQRKAEAHYRIASPWLGLGLVLLSAAIILRGQVRRDLWGRRASTNICACVFVIIMVVIARSLITSNASLWPLIHVSVLLPILISLWLLRSGSIAKKVSSEYRGTT